MITRNTILSVLVAASAISAQAGSLQDSSTGSANISKGVFAASKATLKVVQGSLVASVETSSAVLDTLVEGSVYVLETPSEASRASVDATATASAWVLTTSGKIVKMTINGSEMLVTDPSAASKAAGRASAKAVRVTVDASGRVLTASGEALTDIYGEAMGLVLTGSGEIYAVSEGSVVASYNGTKATLSRIYNGSVQSVTVSAQDLSRMLEIASTMPANSFEASTTSGRQNGIN